MLASIYYILSFLVCYILLLSIRKLDVKVSLVHGVVLTYVLQLCIGTVGVLPLALISVPINIITMAIVYNVVSVFLVWLYVRNGKARQEYFIDRIDVLNFGIMAMFILAVFVRVFSTKINLAYANTDIANHFDYAMDIVRTGKLNTMYFASLNNALIIEVLEPVFSGIDTYKSMIIAETVSNFLSGIIFYVLMTYTKRSAKFRLISPVLMILFFAGWPIYQYVMGGFVYWGIGVTLFLFGLYLLYLYKDFAAARIRILILLGVVLYCIAVCYVLFVPFTAALYAFCLLLITLKNIQNKEMVRKVIFIVGVAVAAAVIVMLVVLYGYFKDVDRFVTFLARDGGIHKEFYRDYIYLVPFVCYIGGQIRKKKEFSLNYICMLTYLLFTLAAALLCLAGIVSPYYYYKFYFILWALVWLVSCDAIDQLLQDKFSWIYSYAAILLFLCAFTFTPLENKFIEKGLIQNSVVEFPLYSAVGSYLKHPQETIYDDSDYWELMRYLEEEELAVSLVTDRDYFYWYNTFFDTKHFTGEMFEENLGELPEIFAMDKECAVYRNLKELLDSDYEILFENNFAVVVASGNE